MKKPKPSSAEVCVPLPGGGWMTFEDNGRPNPRLKAYLARLKKSLPKKVGHRKAKP